MALKPEDRAYQLVNGFRATQVVTAAVRSKIPDLLAGGPMSVDRLSEETKIDADRLRRLLRGLVALGVVAEQDDGRFVNTEVGELFREGVPGSRRAAAMVLVPESYRAWDHFLETIRTGVTGHFLAHGGSLWETLQRDPDFAARFNQAMASNSTEVAGSLPRPGTLPMVRSSWTWEAARARSSGESSARIRASAAWFATFPQGWPRRASTWPS